ncbi:unnamed protein product [Eruca vesicaria subsp. sativa]|uniref:Uncharacterized protein n=1 Tax=Eruca vesicaria subsp. sativa TaxID=29727 RepID=A0ABC8JKD4_ERUVS|nr:unnamed protein product [Eruca vesicaria subsp. sativa]
MARPIPPYKMQPHTVFHTGLVAANLVSLDGLIVFASHPKKKLRRWAACYGSRDHAPALHLQNDMKLMVMNNGTVYEQCTRACC